jgi:hypothetical protein
MPYEAIHKIECCLPSRRVERRHPDRDFLHLNTLPPLVTKALAVLTGTSHHTALRSVHQLRRDIYNEGR